MKSNFPLALVMGTLFTIQPLLGCSDPTTDTVQKSDTAAKSTDVVAPQQTQQEGSAKKSSAAAMTKAADTKSVEGNWGHLTGTVIVDGDVAAQAVEAAAGHPDEPVCKVDGKIPVDDKIVVNPENNGLRDVYVVLYLKKKKTDLVHPDYASKKKEAVVLDNVNCRFVPHAAFVRTGQKLIIKNSDAVGHNCKIQTFNNEINPNIPANSQVEATFDQEDKSLGEVTCSMHPWMDSVIFIRDNPYVAVTDADGKFTIENLPEGEWEFQFMHKNVGFLKKLTIENYKVSRKGVTTAKISNGETTDLGTMKFPAKSFK